jgi:hypothetical protein
VQPLSVMVDIFWGTHGSCVGGIVPLLSFLLHPKTNLTYSSPPYALSWALKQGDMTLKDLIEHFESEYGLEVTMLSYGVSILFSFFQNKKKTQERMPLPMTQVHW